MKSNKKLLRVLWLTQTVNAYESQAQFVSYSKYIKKDFEIFIAFTHKTDLSSTPALKLTKNGVKPYCLFDRRTGILGSLVSLYRLILVFDPKVIHVHHPLPIVLASLCCLGLRTFRNSSPFLISELRNEKKGYSNSARALLWLFQKATNLFLCSSQGVERSFFSSSSELYGPQCNIFERSHFTLFNSIDMSLINERVSEVNRLEVRSRLFESLELKKHSLIFISIGRLEEQKGYKDILQAVYLLIDKGYSDFYVFICGDGSDLLPLTRLSKTLGIESHIIFLGNRADIIDLLFASDVFIIASLWEGLPKSLLEAMAVGLPVVGTRISGVSDVVEEELSGILVNPHKPDELAKMMMRLFSKSLWERLGLRAKKRAVNFDVRRQVKLIEDIYEQIRSASAP